MKPILVNHKPTIEALVKFERDFAEEHGPFAFFGFLLTTYDDYLRSGGDWQVTVAAPWSKDYSGPAAKAFFKGVDEVLQLERWWTQPSTMLLRPDNPGLEPVHDALEIEHDLVELIDVELFGKEIRRAYIITSQRLAAPATLSQD